MKTTDNIVANGTRETLNGFRRESKTNLAFPVDGSNAGSTSVVRELGYLKMNRS